jgi:hypothetical protein
VDRFSTRLGASLIADRHREAAADRRAAGAGWARDDEQPLSRAFGMPARIRRALPALVRFRLVPR